MNGAIHEATRNRIKKARVWWRFVWFRGSFPAVETKELQNDPLPGQRLAWL